MRVRDRQAGVGRYALVVGTILVVLLAVFLGVEALGVPLLTDPTPWMDRAGALPAALGVGLLVVDVALPIPSSLVMITHGALFGLVLGTALTLLGAMGAALLGFAVGRRGGRLLDRFVSAAERERADRLLERWGTLAVLVTRPVPILAETTVLMAGASRMGWRELAAAALVGSVPQALLYAAAGALGASFESSAALLGLALLIAAAAWLIGRRIGAHLTRAGGRGAARTER